MQYGVPPEVGCSDCSSIASSSHVRSQALAPACKAATIHLVVWRAHPLQVGRHSRQQANQRTKSSGPVSSMSMQAEYRRSDERHGWVRAVESLEQLDRVHDTTLASPSWLTKSFRSG